MMRISRADLKRLAKLEARQPAREDLVKFRIEVVSAPNTGNFVAYYRVSTEPITELQASGATTLQAIADGLNRSGILTASGRGEWQASQVARVLRPGFETPG
jgi:hypothetical protein